jgi:flagellin
MNAHRNSVQTNLGLDKSLQRLSSGLRINTAADDASGLAIANQLKAQSTGLGQAISNANDGIGVAQTADGALDEYENIINTVRTKSIQAASDGQNADSRGAIQADITKLLEEAQNIATTTSFNGQNLLDGSFQNKAFHIGAYKDQTVNISIAGAKTTTIGQFAEQTSTATTTALGAGDLLLNGTDVGATADAQASSIAAQINTGTGAHGVTATANTDVTGAVAVAGGSLSATGLAINGVAISGGGLSFSASDGTGSLTTAINAVEDQTGVHASIVSGKLKLESTTGGDIQVTQSDGSTALAAADATALGMTNVSANGATAAAIAATAYHGTVTLNSDNAITVAGTAPASAGLTAGTIALGHALSTIDVQTRTGAESAIQTTDAALKQIDSIRSNIGSTQNQLESTVRNISVTQVNVAAAESQIRDVDFAAESANFAKHNILAQSGTYAMTQANSVQQNVLRLLQ